MRGPNIDERRLVRAVRVLSPGTIDIADVPEPTAGDSVLVKTGQVGICGTDVKILAGKIPVEYPRIMGHEMVGHVVEGPEGSPYPPGTRVLIDPGVACGWCHLCRAGRFNICTGGGLLGRDVDGVFTADPRVVPEARLVPRLGYRVCSALAHLGGRVLHARCVDLAARERVPLAVRSSFRDAPGTEIGEDTVEAPRVEAVAHRTDVSLAIAQGNAGAIGHKMKLRAKASAGSSQSVVARLVRPVFFDDFAAPAAARWARTLEPSTSKTLQSMRP